jgi:bifunctional non-homologous end joining protein LigD
VSGDASRLLTRNGKDWTESFPSLSAALKKLPVRDAVLDMEAVMLDADGKSSFQSLQAALGKGGDRGRIVAYVFDLLYVDDTDLTQTTLKERKERLRTVLKNDKALRYSSHVTGQGAEMFAEACKTGLEGIISKEADAPYIPGRQRSWLKIKSSRRQEFIIVGFSDARKGERALGALYLAYKRNGALQYAGKVGTGFSMRSALELAGRSAKIGVKTPVLSRSETAGLTAGEWRAVHWVEPLLLCEVAFTEWTGDGRIRHPSFEGLREDEDKDAWQAIKEQPMQTFTGAKTAAEKKAAGSLVLSGISITHPDRVISEIGQITKGELGRILCRCSFFDPAAYCAASFEPAALSLGNRQTVLFSEEPRQRSRRPH